MDLPTQIRQALTALSLPVPSQAWLQTLLSARSPPPPLASLIATAKTRLLFADLTTPNLLDPAAAPAFPDGISNPTVREARLPRDVVVQLLDVENLSRSRWEQVEELEAIERGERTQGREIVRLPLAGDGDGVGEGEGTQAEPVSTSAAPSAAASASARQRGGGAGHNATHKVLVQDCKGKKMFGLEMQRIERFSEGLLVIGEKMVIKSGTAVARGVLLLEPGNCKMLGGKVDAWQKTWVEGRLARLQEAVGPGRGRDT